MEIKTSSKIAEDVNDLDTINLNDVDYAEAMLNMKWIKTKEIISFCNDWFDTKRQNNEMWRLNQDELSGLFLDNLEKELKRGD